MNAKSFFCVVTALLVLARGVTSALAQTVSIPDPGLNAAVRQALQIPTGPLTQQDLLSLTVLSAGNRNISNVAGLEAARNLRILDLDNNSLTNFPITGSLTNLAILDLFNNDLTSLDLSNASPNLTIIDVAFNSLGRCSLPDGLTNLDTLFLEDNLLTNFNLPTGLTSLTQLDLSVNRLTRLSLRPEMKSLTTALIFANQLTNLTLPTNLTRLASLDLDFNQLQNLNLPAGLTNLTSLVARNNQLRSLTFPSDMGNLSFVDLGDNQLSDVTLPDGVTRLNFLRLSDNRLTHIALPAGLTNLTAVFLQNNQLTNVLLSSGLNQLVQIDLRTNNLTSLTLPAETTNLTALFLDGNPLATLVLCEPLAGTLAATITALQNQGVNVFTYPLEARLTRLQRPEGAFRFGVKGPPGVYVVFSSTNLVHWAVAGAVNNPLGGVFFTEASTNLPPKKFYRAQLQVPSLIPANMVFIPANTFKLGSPTNEVGHRSDESPQTTVTLTHGFWMSKHLVTQRDYLALTSENPSGFPGDLDRPVESVPWFAASNYCAKLTEQDLATGRIPAGTHYRLPTEAEWECAARAGTTTRFYYGDDPGLTDLTNHAWFSANSGFTTRPVGQKIPNAWGLYDMAGNVWEWCQDWYGTYPGGFVADPQGPASNVIGNKVIRGGAWEASELDCRSARRGFQGASPFITDFIIGFRVVLVSEPQ